MNKLQEKAALMLSGGQVDCVIGYTEGSQGRVRSCFVTRPEETSRLVYDDRCVQNLAVYLTKNEVKKLGRLAIVASLPALRSVMVLVSEHQIEPENIQVLTVTSQGEVTVFADTTAIQEYLEKCEMPLSPEDHELMMRLKEMTPEERRLFWSETFKACIRCYACRQACPQCYCNRCMAEVNQPQWIPVGADESGNMEWHLLRAMHLAGRCVACGDCGRACPMGLPVHLLTMRATEVAHEAFGVRAGYSTGEGSALSTFKPDDREQFIR